MEKIMLISTTETIPGSTITATLGTVKGTTVRAKHLGRDIRASFKNLVGGEIKEYVAVLSEAREEAESRMIEEARSLDADAVVGVRYTTAQVMDGVAEILVYGTAVQFDR